MRTQPIPDYRFEEYLSVERDSTEVLSPSTDAYDRRGKFARYRHLSSLRHYLLIAQDQVSVDVFTRQPNDRWLLAAYADADAIVVLEAPDCRLSVLEIYDRVIPER
jgi:Uma2 family endonuclease